MFEKKLKDPVQINCGLIAFTVRNGVAAADPILIDTSKNVMLGRGGFSFKNEALDLAFRADSKKFSLFSGQSPVGVRSEEHTSELQSLMCISYDVFCLKTKQKKYRIHTY